MLSHVTSFKHEYMRNISTYSPVTTWIRDIGTDFPLKATGL